eukprot:3444795-Alexandrium_andersonii.AAC.1
MAYSGLHANGGVPGTASAEIPASAVPVQLSLTCNPECAPGARVRACGALLSGINQKIIRNPPMQTRENCTC